MKIKHKVGFIAMITIIDIFVIVMVVMSNDKTNIKNDVSTKTSAHVITSDTAENREISEIAASTNTEEENTEEPIEEKTEEQEIEDKIEENEQKEEKNTTENIENVVTQEKNEDNNVIQTNLLDTSETEGNNPPVQNNITYDELSLEEKIEALNSGTLALEYSGIYTNSNDRLTKSRGALYFNGHRETYYSERVLPGTGLNIPGRHVAEDGTVRDGDGYICVASDLSYLPKGAVLITSLGPAKVYDTGCEYGTIDIYVNW